jgi:hypothetical protein
MILKDCRAPVNLLFWWEGDCLYLTSPYFIQLRDDYSDRILILSRELALREVMLPRGLCSLFTLMICFGCWRWKSLLEGFYKVSNKCVRYLCRELTSLALSIMASSKVWSFTIVSESFLLRWWLSDFNWLFSHLRISIADVISFNIFYSWLWWLAIFYWLKVVSAVYFCSSLLSLFYKLALWCFNDSI